MTSDDRDLDRRLVGRLVAGCLMGSFVGVEAPAWLLRSIGEGLGGVLLFAQNVVDDEQVARLCASLRSAGPDVIIAIDEEGGDVTRLDAATGSETPCPAAFGFVDDRALTTAAYRALGRRVHDLGIDLTLAPCADINSNPANPIIGVRSFGSGADGVSRHVVAAVDGFRAGGVGVCVKHFPGHGDTSDDTHLGTACVAASMAVLTARELAPFAAAIDASVDAVLTAHLVAPALDHAPVSLSAAWTHQLRSVMGFEGVIVTDALDMDGVAEGRGIDGVAAAAVRALGAGADLLCLGSNFDEAMTGRVIDTVVEAVRCGMIDTGALESSAGRIAALRRPGGGALGAAVDGRQAESAAAQSAAAQVAAAQVAEAAIVVDGHLQARPGAVIECRPRLSMAGFNVAWGIAADLQEAGWISAAIGECDDVDEVCDAFVSVSAGRPLTVVVRDAGVHPWQLDVVARCCATGHPVTVVELGWPNGERPDCTTYVITHGAARVSARAVVDRLLLRGASTERSKED